MSERIDHVDDAMACLIAADGHLSGDMPIETGEYKSDVIATAQVHATLALVEQQRVGNMIALIASTARGVAEGLHTASAYLELYRKVNPAVTAALGLEEAK